MDIQPAKNSSVNEKPTAWIVAIPVVTSLVVAVFAVPITLIVGLDTEPTLVAWCLVLVGLAVWLNRSFFLPVRALLPFLAAVAIVLLVWFWQRQAFSTLIPHGALTSGYFLTPEGAKARLWVLLYPFWTGISCLSLCCLAAAVSWWRVGARRSWLCMIPWWLAVFVIFVMPSASLDGQGNATIFI